jgi:hypothetical protein
LGLTTVEQEPPDQIRGGEVVVTRNSDEGRPRS